MLTRPYNEELVNWATNDEYKSNIERALRAHPALANIKDLVCIIKKFYFSANYHV